MQSIAALLQITVETDTTISRFFNSRPSSTLTSATDSVTQAADVPEASSNAGVTPSYDAVIAGESSTSTAATLAVDSGPRLCQLRFASDDLKVRAEICWILKCVSSHYSFNSCSDITAIFQQMFADSETAKSFHMGDDRARYVAVFGLAPYFQQLVANKVKDSLAV